MLVGVDLKRASTKFQGICNPGKSIEECGPSRPTGTFLLWKPVIVCFSRIGEA